MSYLYPAVPLGDVLSRHIIPQVSFNILYMVKSPDTGGVETSGNIHYHNFGGTQTDTIIDDDTTFEEWNRIRQQKKRSALMARAGALAAENDSPELRQQLDHVEARLSQSGDAYALAPEPDMESSVTENGPEFHRILGDQRVAVDVVGIPEGSSLTSISQRPHVSPDGTCIFSAELDGLPCSLVQGGNHGEQLLFVDVTMRESIDQHGWAPVFSEGESRLGHVSIGEVSVLDFDLVRKIPNSPYAVIVENDRQVLVSLAKDGTIAGIVAENQSGWEIVMQGPLEGAPVLGDLRDDGTFRFSCQEAGSNATFQCIYEASLTLNGIQMTLIDKNAVAEDTGAPTLDANLDGVLVEVDFGAPAIGHEERKRTAA